MGLLKSLFQPAIPQYENNIIYDGYALTTVRKNWNVYNAKANAKGVLKQIQDCANICKKSTNPLTFFYRYDMLIKRTIELCCISRYVKVTGVSPVSALKVAINDKQSAVTLLIDNTERKVDMKVQTLKTLKAKENAIAKFEASFFPFYDEMNEENILKISQSAQKMRNKYCK